MLNRRNSYPNRRVRAAARSFVRANALMLTLISASTVAICAFLSWAIDGYAAGLFTGVFASTIVAMVVLSFLLVSGMTFQVSGALGETNTADVLRSATRRRLIHGWIDNIEINSGDVDHLVLTQAGIFAVDSKWHSHGLTARKVEGDATAALASAARARSVLRSVHVRRPIVTPLVVVWGGDQDEAHGQRHLGVEFVSGGKFKAWLLANAASGTAFNEWQSKALLGELEAFKRRVRPAHLDTSSEAVRAATRSQQPGRNKQRLPPP